MDWIEFKADDRQTWPVDTLPDGSLPTYGDRVVVWFDLDDGRESDSGYYETDWAEGWLLCDDPKRGTCWQIDRETYRLESVFFYAYVEDPARL